jgi:hypothetical protein
MRNAAFTAAYWALSVTYGLLAALSVQRTMVWMTEESLWREAVEQAPKKLRPKLQLARALPAAKGLEVLAKARSGGAIERGSGETLNLGTARVSCGCVAATVLNYSLAPGETTDDDKISLLTARCIGACSLAPAVTLDGVELGMVRLGHGVQCMALMTWLSTALFAAAVAQTARAGLL